MDNYFDREFNSLEKELLRLKTSAQKSAGVMKTISKTVNVTVNLQYKDYSYPTGSARADAFYEVVTDADAIVIPTLDWYYGDINQSASLDNSTRRIMVWWGFRPNGNIGIHLYFIGTEPGDNSDAARTKRGETVTVSVNLTVLCTQDFVIRSFTP